MIPWGIHRCRRNRRKWNWHSDNIVLLDSTRQSRQPEPSKNEAYEGKLKALWG